MGHYTGAKARINRRLGSMIFESAGAIRASERRSDPPGVRSKRRNKPSTYGEGLIEKQKIKYYYGFGEKQLRRFLPKQHEKLVTLVISFLLSVNCDSTMLFAEVALQRPGPKLAKVLSTVISL